MKINKYFEFLSLLISLAAFISCKAEPSFIEPSPINLEKLTGNLKQPLSIAYSTHSPNKLFIVEQGGKVKVFENGTLQDKLFLNFTSKVVSGGEMGLLNLVFHPNFEKNQKVYVVYTNKFPDSGLHTVYSELSVSKTTGLAEPKSEKILLKIKQPYNNHNGGGLAFGPDGYLYIGVGDGGAAFDPKEHGLNTNTLLGAVLRIDINSQDPYISPPDNPFVKEKKKGRPEIYAWGIRNPWKMSFDSKTGKLWLADVGQNKFEEINIIENGKNYGWAIFEAKNCLKSELLCSKSNSVKPIFSYPHSEGKSITGGYVYRGKNIKALNSSYIYADYVSGKIWALKFNEGNLKVESNKLLKDTNLFISSFGEGLDGELYLLDHRKGALYKLNVN